MKKKFDEPKVLMIQIGEKNIITTSQQGEEVGGDDIKGQLGG